MPYSTTQQGLVLWLRARAEEGKLTNFAPNPTTGSPAGKPPFTAFATPLTILNEYPDASNMSSFPCLVIEQKTPVPQLYDGPVPVETLTYDPAAPVPPYTSIIQEVEGYTKWQFELCLISEDTTNDQTPNNSTRSTADQLRKLLRRAVNFDVTAGGQVPDLLAWPTATIDQLEDMGYKPKGGAHPRRFEWRFKTSVWRDDIGETTTQNTLREIEVQVHNAVGSDPAATTEWDLVATP